MIYEEYSVVSRAISGDAEAYGDLIKKYNSYFYKTAFLYVKNEEDALDIVQQSVYQGFIKIGRLRHPEYFLTWMNRIVINHALKCIKRREKYADRTEKIPEGVYADVFREEKMDIQRALRQLRKKYKDAVVLYYFYDKPVKEIAVIMQIPENTVKTYLKRAKEVLKQMLKEDYFGD